MGLSRKSLREMRHGEGPPCDCRWLFSVWFPHVPWGGGKAGTEGIDVRINTSVGTGAGRMAVGGTQPPGPEQTRGPESR